MKKLVLQFNLVPDTNIQKLQRALPPDYGVRAVPVLEDQPEEFLVFTHHNREEKPVATVRVVDSEFIIEFSENAFSAKYFESWMTSRYPTINPDRLIWLVVWPWRGKYTYTFSPKITLESAQKVAVFSGLSTRGAYLVGFKASEWPNTVIKVVHSYPITGTKDDDYTIGVDEGEKIIELTDNES